MQEQKVGEEEEEEATDMLSGSDGNLMQSLVCV